MRVLVLCLLLAAAVGTAVATDAEDVMPMDAMVETGADVAAALAMGDAEADASEGLAAEAEAAADAAEADEGEEEEGEDTPLRQAQRAMLAEREEAVSLSAPVVLQSVEETVTDNAKAEAKAETGLPGDFVPVMSRRVSGAADSFPLNDRMCVMCQFLVQRGQQDMAAFYGTTSDKMAMAAAAQAGAGMSTPLGITRMSFSAKGNGLSFQKPFNAWSPTNAANEAGHAAPAHAAAGGAAAGGAAAGGGAAPAAEPAAGGGGFLEVSADEGEEEEEEADEEAEDELEFDAESESDWQTPEYSLIEGTADTDAETEDKSDEELAEQFQTPKYQDSVYEHQAEASDEDVEEGVDFEREQSDSDAGTADTSEPVFFESTAKAVDESEGEWTTPEYSGRTEAPAQAAVTDAEAEAEIDAAEEEADSEEAEQAEEVDEAADSAADAAEMDAVFLQTGEEEEEESDEEAEAEDEGEAEVSSEESSWQTPAYTDRAPNAPETKEYARIVLPTSMLEATAAAEADATAASTTATTESAEAVETAAAVAAGKGQSFAPRMISSGANGRVRFGMRREPRLMLRVRSPTPRRYFSGDRHFSRPRWNRFDPNSPRHPNPMRITALKIYEDATHQSYDKLEAYCSTRLPESYGKFCRPILRQFRWVTEGLRYGDRPEQICMNMNMCPIGSYVPSQPHQLLPRF